MTCMRAWMSSKFGRIRPRTTELAALERRAGTIQLSSDTIRIAIHAMRYDTYHDISTL